MSIDWQKYKMKRHNKIRICKICGKNIGEVDIPDAIPSESKKSS